MRAPEVAPNNQTTLTMEGVECGGGATVLSYRSTQTSCGESEVLMNILREVLLLSSAAANMRPVCSCGGSDELIAF